MKVQPRKRLHYAVETVKEKLSRTLDDNHNLRLFEDEYFPLLKGSMKDIVVEMCNRIRDRHKISNDIDKIKYNSLAHYTSLGKVIKMLRKSQGEENDYLRLYDSSNFNDPDEGYYLLQASGISELNESINDIMERTKEPSYIASFVSNQNNENMNV